MKHIEVLVGFLFNFGRVELWASSRQPVHVEALRFKRFERLDDRVGLFASIAPRFVTERYGVKVNTNLINILQNVTFHLIFVVLEAD